MPSAAPSATPESNESVTPGLRLGVFVASGGSVVLLCGLVLDAVLHGRDPSLAEEESVFTLTNPGHLLFLLGLGTTVVGVGLALSDLVLRPGAKRGRHLALALVTILGVAAVGAAVASSSAHDHGEDAAAIRTSQGRVVDSAAAADVDRSRLPPDQAVALVALSWSRAGTVDGHDSSHAHGQATGAPGSVDDSEAELLRSQLDAARQVVADVRTVAEAESLGFVQAGTSVAGVGAHWVRWTDVDRPFDPTRPSMLLFEPTGAGAEPSLVGYSYWVRSVDEPEGFAGSLDVWHQHHGLCFVNGWLRHQDVVDRDACPGDWINGSDLWMLHAWVVPGQENRDGVFADINRSLCPPPTAVPDIMSCSIYDQDR